MSPGTTAPAPSAAWRNRIVGSGEEAPDQLLANPANWRKHSPDQRAALRGSLDTVGWVAQVMVNLTTGHVVDGHARIEEVISRGEPTVPVLYVELSPEEEQLVLATLDPMGALATAEKDALEALLAGLSPSDDALRTLLAELGERNGIHRPILGDPDEMPPVPRMPTFTSSRVTSGRSATIGCCAAMRPGPKTSPAWSPAQPRTACGPTRPAASSTSARPASG